MLPKNRRIDRKMFPLFLNGAKMFKNKLFLLKFVPSSDRGRFSFSVSKKISKSAVVRNKMRRFGYRVISKNLHRIKINALISFSYRQIPKNSEEVVESIESILKESKIIK